MLKSKAGTGDKTKVTSDTFRGWRKAAGQATTLSASISLSGLWSRSCCSPSEPDPSTNAPGKQVIMAQILGPLPHMGGTLMEFQRPGLSRDQPLPLQPFEE